MRIKDLHLITFKIPGIGSTNKSSWIYTNHYYVVIETDVGLIGLGEGTPYRGGIISNMLCYRRIRSELKNKRLNDCEPILNALQGKIASSNYFDYGVFMAADSALVDLRSKFERIPPVKVLGKIERGTIPVYGTVFLSTEEELKKRIIYWNSKKVRSLKIKISGNFDFDFQRIGIIRSMIEDDAVIRVDANGWFFNYEKALDFFKPLVELGINEIEQPFSKGNLNNCARLRKALDCPIILDEDTIDQVAIKRIIKHDAADAIHIHPSKFGCIQKTNEIMDFIEDANVSWSYGASGMTGIGTHSILAILGSRRKAFYPVEEIGHFEQFGIDVVKNPFIIQDGELEIPTTGNGLGDIDSTAFDKYAVYEWNASLSVLRYLNYYSRIIIPKRLHRILDYMVRKASEV